MYFNQAVSLAVDRAVAPQGGEESQAYQCPSQDYKLGCLHSFSNETPKSAVLAWILISWQAGHATCSVERRADAESLSE